MSMRNWEYKIKRFGNMANTGFVKMKLHVTYDRKAREMRAFICQITKHTLLHISKFCHKKENQVSNKKNNIGRN